MSQLAAKPPQHQNHSDERTEREGGEEQVGGEGGGDENLAIGEVHDPRDAVLEREAHGDEGIHAAEDQPAENDVDDQHDDLKGQRLRLPGRLGGDDRASAFLGDRRDAVELAVLPLADAPHVLRAGRLRASPCR